MKSIKIPKKELKYLYEKKELTTYQIADIYNCCQATIWKRLKRYRIRRLPSGRRSLIISKPELRNLYTTQRLSSRKIAKLYSCAYSTIDSKIKKYGFPTRTLAEAHIVFSRKDFDGDKIDKAYLIGFAMGDLRVRKIYPNSETIRVDCGSTKKEQINLIAKLFRSYGRIWVSKPNKRKAIQIECSLNESFNFLLKKRSLIDPWIFKNRKYFTAFLAGFTDAEGCISISKLEQAFYSLGNYNFRLLRQIRNRLIKFRLPCAKLVEGKTKGRRFGKEGHIHNQNYWHFSIHRKLALLHLFDLISPYLKHSARVRGMKMAKQNIKLRNKKYGNINMNL